MAINWAAVTKRGMCGLLSAAENMANSLRGKMCVCVCVHLCVASDPPDSAATALASIYATQAFTHSNLFCITLIHCKGNDALNSHSHHFHFSSPHHFYRRQGCISIPVLLSSCCLFKNGTLRLSLKT